MFLTKYGLLCLCAFIFKHGFQPSVVKGSRPLRPKCLRKKMEGKGECGGEGGLEGAGGLGGGAVGTEWKGPKNF